MTPIRLFIATALATLGLAAPALAVSAGDMILVSRPSTFGPLASPTTNDSLSTVSDVGEIRTIADGHRYVVFMSDADGMVADDDNRFTNVFVRDRLLKTTRLVSRADGPAGAAANSSSGSATISANGRYVAFATNATNLAPGVAGDAEHVYVRDIVSGTTTLVDRADGSDGAVGNDDAFDASIIVANNQPVVAFTSVATNLDGASGGHAQVYMRKEGDTTMLSRQNGSATVAANSRSSNPSLSADGSRVAFQSDATNLTTIVPPAGSTQIFRRTIGTTLTDPVSWNGLWGNDDSTSPSVNKDGTVVAFQSNASNLDDPDTDTDHTSDIYVRDMSTLDPRLESVRSGVKGNGASVQPVITDNADALVFTSGATNLSATPDTNGFPDVFVRTGLFGTGSTTLASRHGTEQADGPSGGASITRNATGDMFNLVRLVVFQTDARNMGPDDEDDFTQVYSFTAGGLVVGDRTALISRPDGDAPFRSGVNTSTMRPQQRGDEPVQSMSQDGRYTVFLSSSDELAPDDDDRWINVFRRDNLTGDTVLVSRADGAGGAAADGPSAIAGGGLSIGFGLTGAPSISADGNRIAFASSATNLVPGDGNGKADVFVRDVAAGTTVLASRKDDDTPLTQSAGDPAISGDGTKVAFVTPESLDAGDAGLDVDVYLRDLAGGTTRLVSRKGANGPSGNDGSGTPAVDFDGGRVAFVTTADDFSAIPDTNLSPDLWVRDVAAGLVIPVSLATGGAAMSNNGATAPAINADGTRVAFASTSTNLGAPGDVNGALADVFMRDLAAGTTLLVSRTNGLNGVSGNGFSQRASIDASGNRIAFETSASDLVPGDSNAASDVLVRDVAAGTTELVSRGAGPGGTQAAGQPSGTPAISGNGQCVAFETTADSFTPMPAGTDHFRVVARALGTDCAFGPVAPPPPPPPPPPGGAGDDTTAPVVTGATLKPTKFLAGKKVRKASRTRKAVGAKLRFTLSEAGAITVRIDALARGRRNAKNTCVKPSKAPKGKRCTRAVRKGAIRKAGVAGANTVNVTGRLKGKNLKPGRYRLRLTVKDVAGNTSKATTIDFRILAP